ncbi:hypothetical protein Pth03_19530 [Planotetraspora thailandica]|uniref:Tetratricopeptide repeat protein n=1 Tax=Planotetraspora thailandica TaxID=487172 RepID=A0A8J3V3W0_9ACTN|nr:tetratricopeptide repeat protein [Planotetraspora thailandica]GII53564.1 hypothetical protein Pth03_19530 [Planotetraspora thailandica]
MTLFESDRKFKALVELIESEERRERWIRSDLAREALDGGDLDRAVSILEGLLSEIEEGPRDAADPFILVVTDQLAAAYLFAARHDDALNLHEQNVAECRELLGPDHLLTLHCQDNLATTLSLVERHDEAITLQEETLAAYRQTLGEDHPDTLTCQCNLAWFLFNAGREECIALYEQTLAACTEALGPDDMLTESVAEFLETAREYLDDED